MGQALENPESASCSKDSGADQIRKIEKELTGRSGGCTLASFAAVVVTTVLGWSESKGWAIVSGERVSRVISPCGTIAVP